MLKKLAKFSLLSFFSFCLSTAALHSVAYAQNSSQQITSESPLAQATPLLQTGPATTPTEIPLPTPTILITEAANEEKKDEEKLAEPEPTHSASHSTVSSDRIGSGPTATPTPTAIPTPVVNQTAGGLNADLLFSMVNNHRKSLGLHELQKDEKTCSLAQERAPEIAAEMAAGTLHSGMYGRNLPYWNTENAIALGSEEAAFNWWLNEPIHRQAMESSKHTHSCTACSGKYCVQEFTSYQPK